jgi:threonine dehydrogenase-like Zn-dependent dehydrogenase
MILSHRAEIEVANTYKAFEVTSPGKLTEVVRALVDPGSGQICLRVEACGVCHTDSATVEGLFPGAKTIRAKTIEVASSHVAMLSHAQETAHLIIEAASRDLGSWR